MTDHRIQRQGAGDAWLEPLAERETEVENLIFHYPDQVPAGDAGELLRVHAAVRQGAGREAVERYAQILARVRPADAELYIDLAQGWLELGATEGMLEALRSAEALEATDPLIAELRAIALARSGDVDGAIAVLQAVVGTEQARPATLYNLGRLLARSGRLVAAVEPLRRAVVQQPNLVLAWWALAEVYRELDAPVDAIDAYRQSLAYDPVLVEAIEPLIEVLVDSDRLEEARRELAYALTVVAPTDRLTALAERLQLEAATANASPDREP
jgi:tetratricopeptide (TPR) repeat protein